MVRLSASQLITLNCSFAITFVISFWNNPTLAGDPFRASQIRNIGDKTESAFDELFVKGNYKQAKQELIAAESLEPNEPLAQAMRASLAYTEKDWETLKIYAIKTLQTAEILKARDPMRGNLYLAVGHFLEGTYNFQTQGPVAALAKLKTVLYHFYEAQNYDSKDPELNLITGYMDLMLAVNLPFASPDQAIQRFEAFAAPNYLVDRGIAIAYRDLDKYDRALEFADKALKQTPENPEIHYLKGQILRAKGREESNLTMLRQAVGHFQQALEKAEQLPESILKPIRRDHRKTLEKLPVAKNP